MATAQHHVLVTGGAGYIGSHCCKELAAQGYTPVTLDNMVYGHVASVKWGPLVEGDIGDRALVDQIIKQYNPVAIMHFAAYAYVGESVTTPGKYYRNNVVGALTLLEAARDHDIKHFIFSSTCATYGEPDENPITETCAQIPINPYGQSKLMVEKILKDFDVAHGIQSIAFRYFNAAGADPQQEIGEEHDPETHLIPLTLDVATGKRQAITIFGDDYGTPDGTCVRDYIHVTDLARAHVLGLKALRAGVHSTAYNLGNQQGFSVKEIITVAREVTGHPIPTKIGARRPGDPPTLIGDCTRAMNELGWQQDFGDIATIVETAWKWQQRP